MLTKSWCLRLPPRLVRSIPTLDYSPLPRTHDKGVVELYHDGSKDIVQTAQQCEEAARQVVENEHSAAAAYAAAAAASPSPPIEKSEWKRYTSVENGGRAYWHNTKTNVTVRGGEGSDTEAQTQREREREIGRENRESYVKQGREAVRSALRLENRPIFIHHVSALSRHSGDVYQLAHLFVCGTRATCTRRLATFVRPGHLFAAGALPAVAVFFFLRA